jgi:hypothetical protein
MSFAELAGWAGAAALLVAYGLLSCGWTTQSSGWFRGLNALGAAGLIVNGAAHSAWPSVTLNVLWLLIGAAGALLHVRRSGRVAAHADQ